VARAAFGDSTAFRRRITDDAQLRQALTLLKKGKSQAHLFALSGTEVPASVN
jgi:hypothetical protein